MLNNAVFACTNHYTWSLAEGYDPLLREFGRVRGSIFSISGWSISPPSYSITYLSSSMHGAVINLGMQLIVYIKSPHLH